MILTPLQKLPNNVGDLGKIIVATGFENLTKVQKSPNLVTLAAAALLCDHCVGSSLANDDIHTSFPSLLISPTINRSFRAADTNPR